jgi:hypothetical protein
MWKYEQSTGRMFAPEGEIVAVGYAGKGKGKNNPAWQNVQGMGPLPRGFYKIGKPYDSKKVGPFALPLTPFPENEMFGRASFRVHGDNAKFPGTASEGCVIMPRSVRGKNLWPRM